VAAFYLDHDVANGTEETLRALGYGATTTRELHFQRVSDAEQLLIAARSSWTLVTHNGKDFRLLQKARRLWPGPFAHAGILIVPQQRWAAAETAARLDRFIRSGLLLINELYAWSPSRGWARYE